MALVFDPNVFQSNVFQVGDASAGHVFQCDVFQHNVFQNTCTVEPPSGSGTILMPSGGTFSRKRYRELMAAIEEARKKAEEVKSTKAKEALDIATQAALYVAFDGPGEEDVKRLISLLEAAADASKTSLVISRANAAARVAKSIMEEIDDEEAILWLM